MLAEMLQQTVIVSDYNRISPTNIPREGSGLED
jgi:hypothetical protein